MHATKRKFNALLQELTSSRAEANSCTAMDPDSSPISHQDLLAKRRRLGFPEATAPVQPVLSLSALSNSPSRRPSTAGSGTAETLSKYCPGDRQQLLKRLATFQELTDWTPKPDGVGEVEWAKRGWICRGKETVRCLLCHKEVVVKLEHKEVEGQDISALASAEVENALVDKYAELIVSSHQQDCLWRRRGCDDTLLRISFSNAKATFTALRERYDELCTRHTFLPYEFNLRLPKELDIDQVLSQLPPGFFTRTDKPAKSATTIATSAVSQPVNRAALALALTGWQGLTNRRMGAVANSASCHTCLRRLGLWMFRSKEVDANGHIVTPAPMDHLDALAEHRFFCPWRSPKAQSKGGAAQAAGLAAWQALLQSVRNEASLRSVYAGRAQQLPATARQTTPSIGSVADEGEPSLGVEADDGARDAKDKERWARLRKVKSMLNTKKLRRSTGKPESIKSNHSSGG
ncbi:hypothetical protein CDD81_7261 [Ophiocordyceps australis]|uniref:C3HC-type domain-containing protein n=1 Tax=Ophiocordyceps australis TaxID=1399860 RepID=A0A2C5Y3P4_9HYPO|nr:hypothetical protein CDD81_7261 [Ophiocordyceps australis]